MIRRNEQARTVHEHAPAGRALGRQKREPHWPLKLAPAFLHEIGEKVSRNLEVRA